MSKIIYLFMGIMMFSCQSTEENKKESEESTSEIKSDTTNEIQDDIVEEPIVDIAKYDAVFNQMFKIYLSPELIKTQNDAIKFMTENDIHYTEFFNPEESRYTLMIELFSENKLNKIEMNYVYDESSEKFISFRNIVSKIEDINRDGVVAKAAQLMNEHTGLTPKKYKKKYGEEGMFWEDNKSEKPHQYFLIIKGGNTDWIELNNYDYWYVKKDEIID